MKTFRFFETGSQFELFSILVDQNNKKLPRRLQTPRHTKKHKRLTEIRKWSKKNHKNCNTSGRTTNKYRQQPFRLYSAKNGRDRFRVTPPTGSLPPKTVAYKRDRDARLQGSVFSKSSHAHTRSTGARSPLLLSPPPKGQSQKFGIIFISRIFVTNGNCRLLV